MKEFKHVQRFEDHKQLIEKDIDEAGIYEIYRCSWRNLGEFHTDFVGEFVDMNYNDIPKNAEVRYLVMDSAEYENTILANCSGASGEDFVCEETGKALVIQFFNPDED